eukprot:7371541-Ditylum_brightwellii.AAC.1
MASADEHTLGRVESGRRGGRYNKDVTDREWTAHRRLAKGSGKGAPTVITASGKGAKGSTAKSCKSGKSG